MSKTSPFSGGSAIASFDVSAVGAGVFFGRVHTNFPFTTVNPPSRSNSNSPVAMRINKACGLSWRKRLIKESILVEENSNSLRRIHLRSFSLPSLAMARSSSRKTWRILDRALAVITYLSQSSLGFCLRDVMIST